MKTDYHVKDGTEEITPFTPKPLPIEMGLPSDKIMAFCVGEAVKPIFDLVDDEKQKHQIKKSQLLTVLTVKNFKEKQIVSFKDVPGNYEAAFFKSIANK